MREKEREREAFDRSHQKDPSSAFSLLGAQAKGNNPSSQAHSFASAATFVSICETGMYNPNHTKPFTLTGNTSQTELSYAWGDALRAGGSVLAQPLKKKKKIDGWVDK